MFFPWWWSESFHRRWSAVRKLGEPRFILSRGVLLFGGALFAVSLIVPAFYGPLDFSFRRVAEHLVICAPGGSLWALLTWHINEWLYSRHSRPVP